MPSSVCRPAPSSVCTSTAGSRLSSCGCSPASINGVGSTTVAAAGAATAADAATSWLGAEGEDAGGAMPSAASAISSQYIDARTQGMLPVADGSTDAIL